MSISLRLSNLDKLLQPIASSSRNVDQQPCGICGRQFARYTCPTCNKPYCSLVCYRSEAHSQCTEPFYRRAVEDEIRGAPSRSVEEKRAMMEMLKRFEEQSAELDEDGAGDSDDEGDGLAAKLDGLDLDSATPEDLWAALTDKQRAEFTRAMQDPESELARTLMSSEVAQEGMLLPWWEASPLYGEDVGEASRRKYGTEPEMMELPPALLQAPLPARPLVYNILAVSLAYAYVTRRTSRSPLSLANTSTEDGPDDADDVCSMLLGLVPFIGDRKSTTAFGSAEGALMDVWSRLEGGEATPVLLTLLLKDAARLLKPAKVSVLAQSAVDVPTSRSVSELDAHPSRAALLMLSDLHALLTLPAHGKRYKPAALKLQFYAAHLAVLPPIALDLVSQEAEHVAEEQDQLPPPDAERNGLQLSTKELMSGTGRTGTL